MNAIDAQAREVLLNRRKTLRRLFEANLTEEQRTHEEVEADWPDRAVAEETATVLKGLSDAERRELTEVEAALDRLAKGTYGRCDTCGGPIGRQRLRAIPEARSCIVCSEQLEGAR